jgi:hypothetical protein
MSRIHETFRHEIRSKTDDCCRSVKLAENKSHLEIDDTGGNARTISFCLSPDISPSDSIHSADIKEFWIVNGLMDREDFSRRSAKFRYVVKYPTDCPFAAPEVGCVSFDERLRFFS